MAINTYKASIYNFLFNSINSIVVIINGIIMVPIYFQYMSVSTYGAWLASGNIIALLGIFESGLSFVITQKLATAISKNDNRTFRVLAGSNILSALIITFIIFVFSLLIAPFISDIINVEEIIRNEITYAFIISSVASCISITVSLLGAFPQVWQDTKSVGCYNILSSLLAIGSILIFLWIGLGVISIALSYLIRALVNFVLYTTWIIRKWNEKKYGRAIFSLNNTLLLIKDCFYPLLSKISSTLVINSQGLLIAHYINPTATAVFDITSKLCFVACGFAANTNGSFFALFSLSIAEKADCKSNTIIKNTSFFFFTLLSSIALYSLCFSEAVVSYWVGIDKFGGILLLVLIVFSNILYQLRSYFNNILYAGGYIDLSSKRDIAWMLSYIILLVITISYLGIYAIPLSTSITCFIFSVIYASMIHKLMGLEIIPIIMKLLKSIIVILPLVAVHYLLNFDYHNLIVFIPYIIFFTLFYSIVLFFTNRDFFLVIIKKCRI